MDINLLGELMIALQGLRFNKPHRMIEIYFSIQHRHSIFALLLQIAETLSIISSKDIWFTVDL